MSTEDLKLTNINHLSTKSSVFHPVQLGAGGQQEIYRHMKRHYERLGRVSAATDSSPPKSYQSSTLVRDREKKHLTSDSFKLPVTSKFVEEQLKRGSERDLISLPTDDSDIRSILRTMPEIRHAIKFRSTAKGSESVGTRELEHLADNNHNVDLSKTLKTPLGSPRRKPTNLNTTTPFLSNEHDTEMKYLKFVSDITREILISSITSDRALNMLFERHITLNRPALNEAVMRTRIEDLKIKLNIAS